MLHLSRQLLGPQPLIRLCARSMGKMDQFKWKPNKKKPNPRPKFPVVLLEDMHKLGRKGQMVGVERGYARNYLVPQGKAAYPTKENIEKYYISDEDAVIDPRDQISSKFLSFLEGLHLKIERKIPFTIGEHQISVEYQRQHVLILPPHCIQMGEPMTSFGDYTINVTVKEDVVVPMKVTVKEWEPRMTERWTRILKRKKESEKKESEKKESEA